MRHRIPFLTAATVILALSWTATAADRAPERTVQGTTITSKRDPAITIHLRAAAQYLGADRWDLYDIADAELHVFVEAGPDKRVQRLYWVQFEQYLPNNTHTYGYEFEETVSHGGRLFDVTASFGPTNKPSRPGSDREHVIAILEKHGYSMPAESMNVRLVDVLDEAKRKELMFIYAEDLASTGMTAAELEKPENAARWLSLKEMLIERTRLRITLESP